MLGNARNISAEKRQAEGYTRARALEALGQLTGGIAHDFNNQLMVILGNAELLAMTGLDKGQGESVELIKNASQSARRLIERLLVFARQSPLGKERIEMRPMLEATIELLSSGLPEWVGFELSIPEDTWRVSADANGLEQAILNLAVNASDAMPKGGTIAIACRNHVVREGTPRETPELKPGDYVVLSVSDEGEGMPPEVASKAFDPFYSTKDVGKGAGLGLSTVYGFAKQAGGHAAIHSKPGEGTRVELYLPRFADQEQRKAQRAERSDPERPGRGERILVVEDQPMVRTHVERLLTKMGYEVTAVSNAKQALSRLSLSKKFDLVFTDVVMPGGMTGQDLAEEIKKIDPTMRILFTSGYPAYAFQHLGITEMQELKLLRKPYRRVELQEAITGLLGD
jgi:nitrogen-specific signal transduction histidine kinase/CheY-like chemotaxis protein